MPLELGRLHQGDCIKGLGELGDASVDLVFADPPFNIGYEYDSYEDSKSLSAYLAWSLEWGREAVRTLKPNGALWLAIGDDYAAELKCLFHRRFKLKPRSWVIWHYTFGVSCSKKFARSHTHLLYFVKGDSFTFNDKAIRVPSDRQLKYNDPRANPDGKIPDDVWKFSRICGTFKERAGFHGCQMPEQVLGRIISSCSNPGDVVLDPFVGSGTTLAVAKKLGRQFIGFELSDSYTEKAQTRIDCAELGQPLLGKS